ncbi:H-NS histone family protein [Xinfangfangia sp. CPCC 101601]|uniref:H-NS histone family protein n=1 Tax=Pseudogemmobacter lacusdianii TaxID=3069608 RepID=A0ABU0VW95_9RHOB|nr:H-NS histone family protein [Xinfangfangia sp. CPCC 101601]MDQ2065205.1 H-NS histone family protein [Xinfangfangia sp. CPCC 101601]
MSVDLHSLSLKELKDLQNQVTKAISNFEERKKGEARAELESRARELGFSLADLTAAAPVGRKRGIAAPKYRNPADASDTWTGRGRKPRWFIDALQSGKSADELSI